ncbi:MAG: hydroxymethylbilane synthase [Candidatus Weimeria sp.]
MSDIVIASRGSRLSMAQVDIVDAALKKCGVRSQRLIISTKGDINTSKALRDIGGNGLFVREIEEALSDGRADIAVHSAKDLPYQLACGMTIGAVVKAASPADLLVIKPGHEDSLHVIGTGSARRKAAVMRLYPDAVVKNIRGNVETRLRKLSSEDYDAIVLARAGVDRLGIDLSGYTVKQFSPEDMIPACGQGIVAVECRSGDHDVLKVLEKINDAETGRRFVVERYLFELMKADCSLAVGVHAVVCGDRLTVYGLFEGRTCVRSGRYSDYRILCRQIADEIYRQ